METILILAGVVAITLIIGEIVIDRLYKKILNEWTRKLKESSTGCTGS